MYNSENKCLDKNLTLLSFNQKINKSFTIDEIKESDLWVVEEIDDVLRCIPLFNCDNIVSSNGEDIVLDDNQCLVCNNDHSTVISCISDDTGGIHYHDISLYAYTPYSKLDLIDNIVVYCVVYDNYLNTLNNVEVTVVVDSTFAGTVITDNNGICKYSVNEPSEIIFNYADNDSNSVIINGS